MRSNNDDRRIKYTKMVLKESLINLLEKKDISQISIKEICEVADINRSTFYSHYSDQYDLLKRIENELLDNIDAHLKELDVKSDNMSAVILAENIFEYIKENAKLCKLLMSERGNFGFQKRVMMLVYDRIVTNITENNKISKEDAEYIYSFTITGCVGIVQKWLDEDLKKSPRFMADMVINLSFGSLGFLKN
ncbi:MAG: transcriptional regulator, TetR family [Clostridiales bacterium]|nr:transcriptional regulator, TetR family [Clostridiales bacterium]